MNSGNLHHARIPESALAQRGFSLIELMIAVAILLVGLVAVVEMIPLSIQSNARNRYDSTAVVLAERELNQIINQPLTATQFNDIDGRVIQLGSVVATGLTGNPVVVIGNSVRINFTGAPVANYNFTAIDPNAAIPIPYEVRWAVISNVQGTTVVSKRFLVGVWKRDPRGVTVPVTVEAWVQR